MVADIARKIAAEQPADPLGAMRVGARLFLDGCSAPEVAQIVPIDALDVAALYISRAEDRAAARAEMDRAEMDTVCDRLLLGIAGR